MVRNFDLVIFDCDGVLVDSEMLSARVLMGLMADVGLPITAEIFRSLEPCAIAMTFTPFRPKAENILPLEPGKCFMPSPTTATIESLSVNLISSISSSRISC